MPFGTVVRDVYAGDERKAMYDALEMLTRGNEWSRAGVYCFWNPSTRQALYIGVTSNLPSRFGQHNTLKGTKPGKGNKGREVNEWFENHQRLGFSVVLQEAIADEEYEPYARNAEGQLLEGFLQYHHKLPPWNSMGGSRQGASFVRRNSVWWVEAMTGSKDSPVVARRTIRELSDDASAEYFENCVHMARTAVAGMGGTNDEMLQAAIDRAIDWRAGPPLFDSDIVPRLRAYFAQPAPHPEDA
ncbi:GIY-YIG nuclease family protein [Mycobacterium sp. E3198]|uniref:GIY-YIG nuclease family protein n=1 Tax=Mycobacterium sp. E3198 TaxID=1834143 RepID=UPI000B259B59|nr:GIY-YIG nuclease family protein [Mycobacterium sp. E3198]